MERGSSYTGNPTDHIQPKNVAQIISGNIHALDRSKHANPNYGSNHTSKLRENQPMESANQSESNAKRRPSSYNEFNRNSTNTLPAGVSSPLTSHQIVNNYPNVITKMPRDD
jgi:hypothetical protein